jgi:predicted DNA repair protein MutK
MATGLWILLDDIATVLDDVAVLTKVATRKTAGVLGDDLALNAQQVAGVRAERELPVIWAVAKGSARNKAILVPAALALSIWQPWAVVPLLVVGGLYLCFEGAEKLLHRWTHPDQSDSTVLHAALLDPGADLRQIEAERIRGAIRTDFILSAEIVVIALGSVQGYTLLTQALVLCAISAGMTVGVYGLVATIVKLDDAGLVLVQTQGGERWANLRRAVGGAILRVAPLLMKGLSLAGTTAMFLVGGGIIAHAVPALHHWTEAWPGTVAMILHGLVGLLAGAALLGVLQLVRRWRRV